MDLFLVPGYRNAIIIAFWGFPSVTVFYHFPGMPFGWDPRFTFQVCLIVGIALILLAASLKMRLRRMRALQEAGDAPPGAKRVILLGRGEKIIESGIPGVFVSLDKFLRDIGFHVESTADMRRFSRLLEEGAPVILGIDWRLGPRALRKIDALCRACFGMRASVVFIYNAARPESLKPPASLPQATFLGENFAGLHVLEILSYAITLEDHAPRPAGSLREGSSLEGKNVGHALPEILQLLEAGRRSGLLSVEDGKPAGVISFEQGVITFAQTRLNEGVEAVMEILSVGGGTFHFFDHKRVLQGNCRITPQDALLQWACRLDENGKPMSHAP